MTELLFIVVSLLLVVVCGIFVAAEFALITVNRATVERLASKGDTRSQGVVSALKTLSTQLSGVQVGITITNLAIGFLAEPALSHIVRGPLEAVGVPQSFVASLAVLIGIALATMVTMVFGELLPKNLAIAKPLATARLVQAILRSFTQLMKYPIRFLNGSANFLLRRIGIEPQEELASARSADELSSLVRRSAEQGTLPKETAAMLERSLTFGELTAQDVMTPRVRVQSLHEDDPVSHVLDLARVTGLSRFPVIRENLDDVIGIIHIKQALSVPKNQRAETKVKAIMQAPVIVPFSLALDSLLEELRKGGLQMAIVIDEFGGMSGIVTVEDLLEELVGEVHDEHDRSGATIRRQKDGSWLLSGLLRPDEIADELDIFLPEEEEFETIAGLVTDRLEHIAEVGDTVLIKAVDRDGNELYAQLKVVRMDGRRIDRIQMRLIADSINLLGSGEAKS